jgi:hypothetical protein
VISWPAPSVFAQIEPHLPPALVGRERLARCRTLAAGLPRAPAAYYVECRLDRDPRADFLVMFPEPEHAAACAASPEGAAPATAWARKLKLLCQPGGGANRGEVPLVWLEYDVDDAFDPTCPQASLSLCLERAYFKRFAGPPIIDPDQARRSAEVVLDSIPSGAEGPATRLVLDRCVGAIPDGGSLIYLSIMGARTPPLLKLYVAVPKAKTLPFLRDIGWPGDQRSALAIVEDLYRPIGDTVFLDLSLDPDGVLGRIGFAFSQLHRTEMTSFDPTWGWLDLPGALSE